MVIDENKGEVVSCQCLDCAASAGGCKHAVAFLMWAHRRSEEPSCTEVECYWRKSALSKVGTTTKYITVEQMSKRRAQNIPPSEALFKEFVQEAKIRKVSNCELLRYTNTDYNNIKQFSLHQYIISSSDEVKSDVKELLKCLKEQLNEKTLASIEAATKGQNKSSLWYELRYGRITAS